MHGKSHPPIVHRVEQTPRPSESETTVFKSAAVLSPLIRINPTHDVPGGEPTAMIVWFTEARLLALLEVSIRALLLATGVLLFTLH